MTTYAQPALPELEPLLWGKRCSKCGESEPVVEYCERSNSNDGRRSHCKVCVAAYQRAYKQSHKDEAAAYRRAYEEENRAEIAATKHAYYEAHKEEIAAYDRAYRGANGEKIAARMSAYSQGHTEEIAARMSAYRKTPRGRAVDRANRARRRARQGGQYLTAAMIQEVQDAANGVCLYCGEHFEEGHIDHIIPVSKGGTNDRENLVYCCAYCNMSKGDKLLGDWLREEQAGGEQ